MQTDELHTHHIEADMKLNNAFKISIALNLLYVFVEFGFGFYTNSLALMSDAGHNLTDVASLCLALLAFKLAKVAPTKNFTYGYSKVSVIISLLNSVILLITVGIIGFEAIDRLQHPQPIQGITIAVVSGFGILVNSLSAILFFKTKNNDINIKGAFLHLAVDALVSLSVVVAGIVIYFTQWFIIDAILSLVVMIVIIVTTWNVLIQSVKLSIDAVPQGVDMDEIIIEVEKLQGVINFHHLHIWPLSTNKNALTGHLVINGNSCDIDKTETIKNKTKELLLTLNIHHATIETEYQNN